MTTQQIAPPTRKPIVIVCDCGGYHAQCDCPAKWAEFNKWFSAGLAERKVSKPETL